MWLFRLTMGVLLAIQVAAGETAQDAPLRSASPGVQKLLDHYTKHGGPPIVAVKDLERGDIGYLAGSAKAKVLSIGGAGRLVNFNFEIGGSQVHVTRVGDRRYEVGDIVDLSREMFVVVSVPPAGRFPTLMFYDGDAEPYLSQHIESLRFRKWTSADGKFSTTAEFVDFSDNKVNLRKKDDTSISVSLNSLSKADREWVRQEVKRRKAAKE